MNSPNTVRFWAFVAIILTVSATLGLEIYLLYQLRTATWANAVHDSEIALDSLSMRIERNLDLVSVTLVGAQKAAETPDIMALPAELRNMVLFDRAAGVEGLGAMMVMSAAGEIVADSVGVPARTGNYAARDYFQAHVAGGSDTYVSQPYESRLRHGDPSIVLSRRVSHPDGAFDGIVAAALRLTFFRDLFAQINIGPQGAIALVRTDGRLVARQPAAGKNGPDPVGLDMAGSPVFQHMISGPETGAFTLGMDGFDRHYVYRHLAGFPLVLSVAFAVDDVLADWYYQAALILALGATLCIGTVCLILAFRKSLELHFKIEQELESLTYTDRLTGLPNRRYFDEQLEREWKKAARSDEPLSVLMVEIDRLRQADTASGHGSNDDLLKSIADQLRASLLRPADGVARYDGEEFAVLLPNTTRKGAVGIAERLRIAVEKVEVRDTAGRVIKATASIGCVTTMVAPGASVDEGFRAADRARHMAKKSGPRQVKGEETFSRRKVV